MTYNHYTLLIVHYLCMNIFYSRLPLCFLPQLECCGISNYSVNFPYDAPRNENKGFFADKKSRSDSGVTHLLEVIPITCCKSFNYKNTLSKESFTAEKECLQDLIPKSEFAYTEVMYIVLFQISFVTFFFLCIHLCP